MHRRSLAPLALAIALSPNAALADDDLRARLDRLEREHVRLMIENRRKTEELERLRARIDGRAPAIEPDPHGHGHGGHAEHSDHAESSGHAEHSDRDGHSDHAGHGHGGGLPEILISRGGVTLFTPSIAIDTALYHDDGDEPLEERLEGLRGFGHGHGHDHEGEEGGHDDEHGHALLEDGFNLRHAEIGIAAGVDGFGRAQILVNGSEDGVELEEAYIQTERFGDVVDFRIGQFPSGYGFTNDLHLPERDFADRDLPNYALFGDHGLEGLGARMTVTPPNVPVELGLEVFNADGETLFADVDGAGDIDQPGVVVGWVKGDVPVSPRGRLSLGLAGGFGSHQESHGHEEEHEEEDHHDEHDHDEEVHLDDHGDEHAHDDGDDHDHGEEDEFLDGDAWFVSPSIAYHHDGGGEHGEGDFRMVAEYTYREKDLDILGEDGGFDAEQDGLLIEAAYGLVPKLRVGARYEHIGLTNSVSEAGDEEDFDDSWRVSGFASYRVNDYARVGVQANYGEYDFEDGKDEVFQVLGRVTIQLGPHLH